ncbi:hypothetical protein DFJ58DRAFT_175739 [Suillus subalutaceus]|uniref:uncharacterized protein n=1 Tax=Suillus subalutaceus TaxID=48586 RepID=UPI001B85FAE0|nr:uncharacterized protein DFJ58DRAFT_175739 [Suillus subalutaceus]KAG1876434.1 hypothetical protein DFJ58DRAFT_175739 [Suillus subalutaceus]
MSRASRVPAARPMTRSMTAPALRRSTRLSGVHAVRDHTTAPQQLARRKRNRRVTKISRHVEHLQQFKHGTTRADCTGTQNTRKPNSFGRSLSPDPHSAPDNVSARETELILKEKEFRLKSRKLEQQLATVSQKEREVAKLLEEFKERLVRTTIRQLEDYFTCPL